MSRSGRTRQCPLCLGPLSPATLEHAVPQWASRALSGEGDQFEIEFGGDSGMRRWRSKKVAQITVSVCQSCHQEINRQSEDWAALRVRPLVAGRPEAVEMSDPELDRLAHWIFKTLTMLDLVSADRLVPQSLRPALISLGRPPARTFIWAGTYDRPAGGAFLRSFVGHVEFGPGNEFDACLQTLRLGGLLVQSLVLLSGPPRAVRGAGLGLFPVWPPAEGRPPWRPSAIPALDDADFLRAHDEFFARARIELRT